MVPLWQDGRRYFASIYGLHTFWILCDRYIGFIVFWLTCNAMTTSSEKSTKGHLIHCGSISIPNVICNENLKGYFFLFFVCIYKQTKCPASGDLVVLTLPYILKEFGSNKGTCTDIIYLENELIRVIWSIYFNFIS